ncbi:MAG TPA: STAS domain-containing protein [Actinomycetota bacterium]|nr:STAS domain-containing protein [Actinomycetota bacterium]
MYNRTTDAIQISVARGQRCTVVHCGGEVDLCTSAELNDALRLAIEQQPEEILLLCRDVKFMDSAGIHTLVNAAERARRQNIRLHVMPSPLMSRLVDLLGLRGHFDFVDAVHERIP